MSFCPRPAHTLALLTLVTWVSQAEAGNNHGSSLSGPDNSEPLAVFAPVPEDRRKGERSPDDLTGNSATEPATDAAETQDRKSPPQTGREVTRDPIVAYLFGVYQRSPTKRDGHGDFTWKDQAAAERVGMSIQDYVIGGMDPDFREQLYHAGLAMDRAGISWIILSGFRDDYRQDIAVGLKAHAGNSFHGGTLATGGYGHGCAVDLGSVDGLSNQRVWQWVAVHGAEFGLRRPLPERDPAHVQPRGAWHELQPHLDVIAWDKMPAKRRRTKRKYRAD